MLETPGVVQHRATMLRQDDPADDDRAADDREPTRCGSDGPAERARLIACGVLHPADGRDTRGEWITRGAPCLAIDDAGRRAHMRSRMRYMRDT